MSYLEKKGKIETLLRQQQFGVDADYGIVVSGSASLRVNHENNCVHVPLEYFAGVIVAVDDGIRLFRRGVLVLGWVLQNISGHTVNQNTLY